MSDLNHKQLVKIAKDINATLGPDPEIDIELPDKKLLKEILDAGSEVSATDEVDEETREFLEEQGVIEPPKKGKKGKKDEDDDADDDDDEPKGKKGKKDADDDDDDGEDEGKKGKGKKDEDDDADADEDLTIAATVVKCLKDEENTLDDLAEAVAEAADCEPELALAVSMQVCGTLLSAGLVSASKKGVLSYNE